MLNSYKYLPMSEFSLIFVSENKKTSDSDNMATKIVIKSDKYTPLGGIFYVINLFNTTFPMSSTI